MKLSKVNQRVVFEQMYLPILFEVFYTLAVFAEIGLVHNDLHAGNVFVEQYAQPQVNCYLVNGRVYRIVSKYQARIFDFDRGAKLPTQFDSTELRNTLLSRSHYCDFFGQCQSVDERRELFTLCYFAYLNNKQANIYLDAFLSKIVPIDLLSRPAAGDDNKVIPGQTLVWSGRLCACKNRQCKDCVVIDDKRILTPKQILALPEFSNYVISPDDIGNNFVWSLPSEAANNPAQRFAAAAQEITSAGK